MKKIKASLIALSAILVMLLPVSIILGVMLITPPQYSNTFTGALDEKYDRLYSIEGEKAVVVGGSSVAFGLDSELLEKYLGKPVVNFGLYADLGTKIMLDLSIGAIGKGDTVIIAPELSQSTMSMFFNAKTLLEAADDKPSMLRHVKGENILSLLSASWEHSADKLGYAKNGAPDPSGVYNSKSFNEYGDVVYPREKNIMPEGYDPNTEIILDESILDPEFIDYLNSYITQCKMRGADVYFSFSPMNIKALSSSVTKDSALAFEDLLEESLLCPVIGDIGDYILGEGYFYDTNFHLNDVGAQYRTLRLIEDIILEEERIVLVREPYPEEPDGKGETVIVIPDKGEGEKEETPGGSDTEEKDEPSEDEEILPDPLDPELTENTEYFLYEVQSSGNLRIVGLTSLGLEKTELTVPAYAKLKGDTVRRAITSIGSGAFSGSLAEVVNIPKDSYLSLLQNGCFEGAARLKRLNIFYPYAENINPPRSFFGTHSDFEIHAPIDSEYKSDYYWHQVSGAKIILDLVVE